MKWYYCSKKNGGKCQGVWRAHSPSKCRGDAKSNQKPAKKGRGKTAAGSKRKADALRIIAAQEALVDEEEQEEQEELGPEDQEDPDYTS